MILNNLSKYNRHDDHYIPKKRSLSKSSRLESEESSQLSSKLVPRTQSQIKKRNSLIKLSTYTGMPIGKTVNKAPASISLNNFVPLLKSKFISTPQSTKYIAEAQPLALRQTDASIRPSSIKPRQPLKPPSTDHTQQLWKMRINDLFFCTQCYKYVFRIEFDSHYPKCTRPVIMSEDKGAIGKHRMELLKELAASADKTGRVKRRIQEIQCGKSKAKDIRERKEGYFYRVEDLESVVELVCQQFFSQQDKAIQTGFRCMYF